MQILFIFCLLLEELGSQDVAQAGLECATLLSNQVRVRSFIRVKPCNTGVLIKRGNLGTGENL